MVLIVETGISLMELDCLSKHLIIILLRFVELGRVEIGRNSGANSPTVGIYHCDISTNAVHDDTDISVERHSICGTVY